MPPHRSAQSIMVRGEAIKVPGRQMLFIVSGPWPNGRKAYMQNQKETLTSLQERIEKDMAKAEKVCRLE